MMVVIAYQQTLPLRKLNTRGFSHAFRCFVDRLPTISPTTPRPTLTPTNRISVVTDGFPGECQTSFDCPATLDFTTVNFCGGNNHDVNKGS